MVQSDLCFLCPFVGAHHATSPRKLLIVELAQTVVDQHVLLVHPGINPLPPGHHVVCIVGKVAPLNLQASSLARAGKPALHVISPAKSRGLHR